MQLTRSGTLVLLLLAGCDPSTPSLDAPLGDTGPSLEDVPLDAPMTEDAPTLDDAPLDAPTLDASTPDASTPDAPTPDAGTAPAHETITVLTDACATMPTDYGTYGPVTEYDRYEFENPAWPAPDGNPIVVFSPMSDATERPVLFYSHAFGGVDWSRMLGLFEMLISHDYVLVFVPYPTTGPTVCGRYDILETGFSEAVSRLRETTRMDTTRVGYLGHSFGGGASGRMAHEGVVTNGYGSRGSFVFSSAAWYVYRMDEAAWDALSARTRLFVIVYEDDTVNDHRMAIDDVFTPFRGTKDFLRLRSATHGSCVLEAGHGTPPTYEGADALDTWGLWRHAHALAECTLRGDAAACEVLDDTTMGVWRDDDTPVEEAVRELAPVPSLESSAYTFPITEERACGG